VVLESRELNAVWKVGGTESVVTREWNWKMVRKPEDVSPVEMIVHRRIDSEKVFIDGVVAAPLPN
jgi:hypothetical protein